MSRAKVRDNFIGEVEKRQDTWYYLSMAKRLTLLIDADDTVLDFNASEYQAVVKLAEDYSLGDGDAIAQEFKRINRRMWDMFERGEITREEIFYTRFYELFDKFGIEGKDVTLVGDAYRENVAESTCVIRGARAFLERTVCEHDLYCVTNGVTRTQKMRFKNTRLDKFFKKIYISQEIGLQKPNKDFFDYVLKDIGITQKEDVYIIGDSLSSDIQGGINAGIKTVLFNRENKQIKDIVPDYQVKNYRELTRLIDKLAKKESV